VIGGLAIGTVIYDGPVADQSLAMIGALGVAAAGAGQVLGLDETTVSLPIRIASSRPETPTVRRNPISRKTPPGSAGREADDPPRSTRKRTRPGA
jgi:hypothetical protein